MKIKLQHLLIALTLFTANVYAEKPVITDEITVNNFIIPPLWFNAYENKYQRGEYLGDGKWAKPENPVENLTRLRENVIMDVILAQQVEEKQLKPKDEHTQRYLNEFENELSSYPDNDNSSSKAATEITKRYFLRSVYLDNMSTTLPELIIDRDMIQEKYDQMLMDEDPLITNTAKYKVVFIAAIENEKDAIKAVKDIRNGGDFMEIGRKLDGTFDAAYAYNNTWRNFSEFGKTTQKIIPDMLKGEVSDPYSGIYGWYILKVLDKKVLETPYLDSRLISTIRSDLFAVAREKHFRKLRNEADVKINGKRLELPSNFNY